MNPQPHVPEKRSPTEALQNVITYLELGIDVSTIEGLETLVDYIEQNRNSLKLEVLTPLYYLVNLTASYYKELNNDKFLELFTRLEESVYMITEL